MLNIKNTFYGTCTVSYVLNKYDNCADLESKFGIELAGVESPNPFLNCAVLIPGQSICIVPGQPLDQGCEITYTPDGSATCDTLIAEHFGGNATDFFLHNPGLYCDRLIRDGIAIQDICIKVTEFTTNLCSPGLQTGTVQSGHNCQYLYHHYFAGSASRFYEVNGYLCSMNRPQVRQKFCFREEDRRN